MTGGTVNDTGGEIVFTDANLVVTAARGVGTTTALNVAVSNLEAAGETGGVYVSNTGPLTIGGIGEMAGVSAGISGNVSIAGDNSITVTENVTTTDGNLTLEANKAGTAAGNFVGIDVNGATLQVTGSGTLTLDGAGGSGTADRNYGVHVRNRGQVLGGSGAVSVTGEGGSGGGLYNYGVLVSGTDSLVESASGDVTVTGIAGGGTTGTAIRLMTAGAITTAEAGRNITLIGDSMDLAGGSVNAGSGTVTLRQYTAGTAIDLGGADMAGTPGTLGLTDAELDRVTTTNKIVIGDAGTGTVTFTGAVAMAHAHTLEIVTGGKVEDAGSTTLFADANLVLTAAQGVGTTGPLNIAVSKLEAFGGTGGVHVTNSGDLTIGGIGALDVNPPAATAGVDYDQIVLTGALNLSGANVRFRDSSGTVAGSQLVMLIVNDGTGSVTGTFAGLPEGETVTIGGDNYAISYSGGDGNDVRLLEASTPTVVYVDGSFSGQVVADADRGSSGEQWAVVGGNAFTTINAALAAVADGGTIVVNGGTYPEAVTLTGNRSLRVTGPDAAQTVTINALTTAPGQNVQLDGESKLIVGNATSTTLAGVVSGSGSLEKAGTGTLTLSGNNAFSGGFVLGNGTENISQTATATDESGGFVVVGHNHALGSGTVTAKGAQLRAATTGIVIANEFVVGAGELRFGGNHDLVLSGAVSHTAVTLVVGNYSGGPKLTLSGDVTLTGDILFVAGWGSGDDGTTEVSGEISGQGGVNLDSSCDHGTVILSGANTYSGTTAVNAGILAIQHDTALGTTAGGTTVAAGATLQLQGGITVEDESLTLAGSGAPDQSGALVNVSGTNTYRGLVTMNESAVIASDADSLVLNQTFQAAGVRIGL